MRRAFVIGGLFLLFYYKYLVMILRGGLFDTEAIKKEIGLEEDDKKLE